MSTSQADPISPLLDEVACEAIGASLDVLASGETLSPTAYFAKRGGEVEQVVFSDDDAESCLLAAKRHVHHLGKAADVYAIAYDGFVQADKGSEAHDAVIVEFGERGSQTAYSASVLYEFDKHGRLSYADPAPAGEGELLL